MTEQYETIGNIKLGKLELPILNIILMDDERYQKMAIENAIDNYTKEFGYAPESKEVACKWQREKVRRLLKEEREVE